MPVDAMMFVYTKQCPQEEDLSCLRSELMTRFDLDEDDFGSEGPFIRFPREDFSWVQLPEETGHCLFLNSSMPYYGRGYERGYLPQFVQIAEWCEEKFPECSVFYGEDSSCEGFPFDRSVRAKFMDYYEKVGHEPYLRHFPSST